MKFKNKKTKKSYDFEARVVKSLIKQLDSDYNKKVLKNLVKQIKEFTKNKK